MILWILSLLVVSSGGAAGHQTPQYVAVQKSMTWTEARRFCQKHFVDLAVPNTEKEYIAVINCTASNPVSFWLGLRRQSIFSSWTWVSGEELGNQPWYRINTEGRCASLEAMKEGTLLARYCDETHLAVCQGPVSPDSVEVTSVGADHFSLSWNVSAFMQMTPHSYVVTVCSSTCRTIFHSQTEGSSSAEILISNLTSATQYFVSVAASVVRPDHITDREKVLQNDPTTLVVRTVSTELRKSLSLLLRLIKVMPLVPSLWLFCYLLTKEKSRKPSLDGSSAMQQREEIVDVLIPCRSQVAA